MNRISKYRFSKKNNQDDNDDFLNTSVRRCTAAACMNSSTWLVGFLLDDDCSNRDFMNSSVRSCPGNYAATNCLGPTPLETTTEVGRILPSDHAFSDILLDGIDNGEVVKDGNFILTNTKSSSGAHDGMNKMTSKTTKHILQYRGQTIYEISTSNTSHGTEKMGVMCTCMIQAGNKTLKIWLCNLASSRACDAGEANGDGSIETSPCVESFEFPLEELVRKSALTRQEQLFASR